MKKIFLSFIALVMVAMQGFAGPVDSLSTTFSGQGPVGDPDCLTYVDGEDPSVVDPGGGSSAYRNYTVSTSKITFTDATVGKATKKTFTVKGYNLTASLRLACSSDVFSIDKKVITAAQAAKGVTVTVTYSPTKQGSHTGSILIKGGGVTGTKGVSLSGTAVVRSITITPSTWDFGTVEVGQSVTKKITIKGNKTNKAITLSNWLETTGGEYSVYPTTLPASGGTVTVTFKPSAAGSSGAQFTFDSGDVYARLTVSGKAKPAITVNPSSLYFTEGASKQFTVKVRGANADVTLALSGTGAKYFHLSKTKIPKASAYNTTTVSVLCNPTSTLSKATANVVITCGNASKTVSLTYAPFQPLQISSEESDDDLDVVVEEVAEQTAMEAPANSTTAVNELAMNSRVYADGQNIVIESAVDQSAVISDIAGHARRVNLIAGSNVIPVNGNGIHIVKVGDKTTKLMIK